VKNITFIQGNIRVHSLLFGALNYERSSEPFCLNYEATPGLGCAAGDLIAGFICRSDACLTAAISLNKRFV